MNYTMISETFVYDNYALIEIINGNAKYEDYLDKKIIINDFIFAELCYVLKRDGYPNSEKYLERFGRFIVHVSVDVINKAMVFRFVNKEKRMSMTDCVSYFMAIELGIKFLTGDKEFENMDSVEFVRK